MNNPTVLIHTEGKRIELITSYRPDDSCSFTLHKGFYSDGASIPRYLWSSIGSPFHPQFIPAALYHDYLYFTGCVSREEADKEFYRLLRLNGVGWFRAKAMYNAVRLFGKNSYVK